MKKLICKIGLLAVLASPIISGCSNFEELNSNPDVTTKVNPALLATNLIKSMVTSGMSYNSVFFQKQAFYAQGTSYGYQYNLISNSNFDQIRNLTNAQKMMELSSEEMKDAYSGLFYFMKGWAFWRATMEMGDIPYSQALQINEFRYPKFDSQKDVFIGILNDLTLADEHFSKAKMAFPGDPFYNGDPQKWRKATNVLRLKVLMSLQKRADDTPELKVKEEFKKIVTEGNLFEGNDDNLQVVYAESPISNRPPYHVLNYPTSDTNWCASDFLVNPLKEYEDIRLFYYFAPIESLTDPALLSIAKNNGIVPQDQELLAPNDWNAYVGMNPAGEYIKEVALWSNNMHSKLNEMYRFGFALPCIRLGYTDMNFILAEAVERGWISGSAKTYYDNGVRANFEFIRKYFVKFKYADTEYDPTHGVEITDEYITKYLSGSSKTAYKEAGSQTDRLHQIWMQSYIASYWHQAFDEYFNYRRNGYPEWPIDPATNMNDRAPDKIPTRYLYPTSEYNYNNENREAAVKAQGWGAEETINDIMWLIK